MSAALTNPFQQACGASGPLQLKIESLIRKATFGKKFFLPFAIIGRDDQADLALDDPDIDLQQVYLQMVEGRLFYIDLRAQVGNGESLSAKGSGWLACQDVLEVGSYTIRFMGGGQGDYLAHSTDYNPLSSPTSDRPNLSPVVLDFYKGARRLQTWRMNRALVLVGSSTRCRVRLTGPKVPVFHSSLVRTTQGTWVVSLQGGDGINLNGKLVRWGRLENGDTLRVGKFDVRVRLVPLEKNLAPEAEEEMSALPSALNWNTFDQFGTIVEQPLPVPLDAPLVPAPIGPANTLSGSALVPSNLVNESLVLALADQFAAMQNQMFDQFQQTILMVIQRFGALHEGQMAVIRQESERLRELARELETIKTELAKTSRIGIPSAPLTHLMVPQAETNRPGGSVGIRGPRLTPAVSAPVSEESSEALKPNASIAGSGAENHPRKRRGRRRRGPRSAPILQRTEATAANKSTMSPTPEPAPDSGPAANGVPETMPQPDGDIHRWLYQRMEAIQKEGQTRWQRILSSLIGK
jgi:hypothetical protein